MRILVILDSQQQSPGFFPVIEYLSEQNHTLGVFDLSWSPERSLFHSSKIKVLPISQLDDARIEYYQIAFCMYEVLPLVQDYGIYLCSLLPDSAALGNQNMGADCLFVSVSVPSQAFVCINVSDPSVCVEMDSGIAPKIEMAISYFESTFLKNGDYPQTGQYSLEAIQNQSVQAGTLTLNDLITQRKACYLKTISQYDSFSDIIDSQNLDKTLEELLKNHFQWPLNDLERLWNIILYAAVRKDMRKLLNQNKNVSLYLLLLKNELYSTVHEIYEADPHPANVEAVFSQGIAYYHEENYGKCEEYLERFFASLNPDSISWCNTDQAKNTAEWYMALSKIETDILSVDDENLISIAEKLLSKRRTALYRALLKRGKRFFKEERPIEGAKCLELYNELSARVKRDKNHSYHQYLYHQILAQQWIGSGSVISGFLHITASIFFIGRDFVKKVIYKIQVLLQKITVKWKAFSFRAKKFLRRKCKFFLCGLHIYGKNERRLLSYKDKYIGKRCFVLGNGPSLSVKDLDQLYINGEYCFACNKIYKIFEQTKWRPNFYACTDSAVFRQNHCSILNIGKYPKFLGSNLPEQSAIKNTSNAITLNYGTRPIEKTKFNPLATYIYSGGTVTYVLITLAWMMGFREIYLIGCDHSYGFFSGIKSGSMKSTSDTNKDYFMRNYMRPGEAINVGNLDRSEQGYRIAREYIESHGGKIFNATRGGKLEVFSRVDLDQLLKTK